ncbi:MAG TPA: AtpZ/AtpI family protein [Acidobacteriaceae bacterium]|nr:AtpZ/AtpI family protein [Acidobacteriaceae bacterium]
MGDKVWSMADGGDSSKKKGGMLGDLVKAETMVQLALAVPGGCLVGWLIGLGLDKHFHTEWIQIAGIVVGAIAGFLQIFRTASGYLKRGGN